MVNEEKIIALLCVLIDFHHKIIIRHFSATFLHEIYPTRQENRAKKNQLTASLAWGRENNKRMAKSENANFGNG